MVAGRSVYLGCVSAVFVFVGCVLEGDAQGLKAPKNSRADDKEAAVFDTGIKMPSVSPDPEIDYKILTMAPDPNIDYKINRIEAGIPPSGMKEKMRMRDHLKPLPVPRRPWYRNLYEGLKRFGVGDSAIRSSQPGLGMFGSKRAMPLLRPGR